MLGLVLEQKSLVRFTQTVVLDLTDLPIILLLVPKISMTIPIIPVAMSSGFIPTLLQQIHYRRQLCRHGLMYSWLVGSFLCQSLTLTGLPKLCQKLKPMLKPGAVIVDRREMTVMRSC